MTPNRRIILHIGSPKCGSTYLQQVMLKNQSHLLEMGINYPHNGSGHPGNGSDIDNLTVQSLEGLFPNGPNWTERAQLGALKNNKRTRSLATVRCSVPELTHCGPSAVQLVCMDGRSKPASCPTCACKQ